MRRGADSFTGKEVHYGSLQPSSLKCQRSLSLAEKFAREDVEIPPSNPPRRS